MSMQYTKPTDAQIELMQEFRDKYEALAIDLNHIGIKSRGMALAFTHLEESAMWLNKAITENDGGLK